MPLSIGPSIGSTIAGPFTFSIGPSIGSTITGPFTFSIGPSIGSTIPVAELPAPTVVPISMFPKCLALFRSDLGPVFLGRPSSARTISTSISAPAGLFNERLAIAPTSTAAASCTFAPTSTTAASCTFAPTTTAAASCTFAPTTTAAASCTSFAPLIASGLPSLGVSNSSISSSVSDELYITSLPA
ncbi:hypothetical protein LINPERPRIM_LOCUS28657 [Linum perenne]